MEDILREILSELQDMNDTLRCVDTKIEKINEDMEKYLAEYPYGEKNNLHHILTKIFSK